MVYDHAASKKGNAYFNLASHDGIGLRPLEVSGNGELLSMINREEFGGKTSKLLNGEIKYLTK